MSGFSSAETAACRRLVELALEEDFGGATAQVGDVTSRALLPAGHRGTAYFVARAAGVIAGLPAAALVCAAVDASLDFAPLRADGDAVTPGTRLASVSGPINILFAAERTALNFLQRLSGIATLTRRYVEAVAGLPAQIIDTRKTTPGWRLLEKYAVRCGGGHNHRIGLFDQFLIKDNHLAAGRQVRLTIPQAVRQARQHPPLPVEIEVDTLDQFDEALAAGPDIVLLDNMPPDVMREAAQRRAERAPQVLLEASGGVNLQTVRAIAETGVDRISVGALTHSAPALDIALDYEASAP
jgi:nicotinate-nucleotide pyrophosphorylase (carboxylating)